MKKKFNWAQFIDGLLLTLLVLFLAIAIMPVWRDQDKQYYIKDWQCWFYSGLMYIVWLVVVIPMYIDSWEEIPSNHQQ